MHGKCQHNGARLHPYTPHRVVVIYESREGAIAQRSAYKPSMFLKLQVRGAVCGTLVLSGRATKGRGDGVYRVSATGHEELVGWLCQSPKWRSHVQDLLKGEAQGEVEECCYTSIVERGSK